MRLDTLFKRINRDIFDNMLELPIFIVNYDIIIELSEADLKRLNVPGGVVTKIYKASKSKSISKSTTSTTISTTDVGRSEKFYDKFGYLY